MKLGNLNSLHYALIGLVVLVVVLMGASNVRQQRAETRLLNLVSAIKSANSLEELQSFADGVLVSSGAGRSVGAAYWSHADGCWIGERGSDAGYCTVNGDGEINDNPFEDHSSSWFSRFFFW